MIKVRMLKGVSLCGVRPEVLAALPIIHWAAYALGAKEVVITSARDGVHSQGSLHYAGQAIDHDVVGWDAVDMKRWADLVRENISAEYDCIDEPTHLHLEWQPKKNTRV